MISNQYQILLSIFCFLEIRHRFRYIFLLLQLLSICEPSHLKISMYEYSIIWQLIPYIKLNI